MKTHCLIFFSLFCLNIMASELTISIEGIKIETGNISIGLYDDGSEFPNASGIKKGAYLKATKTLSYTFKNLSDGDYAIAIYHDLNSNKKLDTMITGMPTEPYAFSNNVYGVFKTPPSFEDATIKIQGKHDITISFQ